MQMPEGKLVKVRLGKEDYLIPERNLNWRLVRITSHPLDVAKVLVWRQLRGATFGGMEGRELSVHEALKSSGMLVEAGRIANLNYLTYSGEKGKYAYVYDFIVDPKFRMKTLGSALRETMFQDLKGKGVNGIAFPPHVEKGFYLKRGLRARELRGGKEAGVETGGPRGARFTRIRIGYEGGVNQLGVKPAGIRLKVLWQRSRPRYA